jgi:hypothetical protein
MAQLNDFISQVKSEGIMRNNRYIVTMPIPNSVGFTGDIRKVLLFCDSIALPGVSLSTTPARTYGELREMPYEKLFSSVPMSFYVDNSMHVKQLFDKWQGAVQDPNSRNINYYRDYITNIDIDVLDIFDNTRYQVTLHEAYPKEIGSIQMDYSNRDVMKLGITMNYKYWTSGESTSGVNYPDNSGFFDKLISGFLGGSSKLPTNYFNDFPTFQSGYNNNKVVTMTSF